MPRSMLRVSRDGPLLLIELNRPEVLNALNPPLLRALQRALRRAERDAAIRCVLVTGRGRAFASGGDIRLMSRMTPHQAQKFGQLARSTFALIEALDKPVVAAVNGAALGGGYELALMCDLCIAAEGATFGEPAIGLGITTVFGGTSRLPRLIGLRQAKELFFTGRRIDAQEAERLGLVNRVVPDDQLLKEAKSLCRQLANAPPIPLAAFKHLANAAVLQSQGARDKSEIRAFAACFGTREQRDRMRAFLERRRPSRPSRVF